MNTASSSKINYYTCVYCFCGGDWVHQPNYAEFQHNMQTNWKNRILCYGGPELPEYLTRHIPRVSCCLPILRTHLQKLVCDFMAQSGGNSPSHTSWRYVFSPLLSLSGLLGFPTLLRKVWCNQYQPEVIFSHRSCIVQNYIICKTKLACSSELKLL